MSLLHPGDGAQVPHFVTPEDATRLGAIVPQVHYGPYLRAQLIHQDTVHPAVAEAGVYRELLDLHEHAASLLGLCGIQPPHIVSTYQSNELRKFAWHRDDTQDIRLLANVGDKQTTALLAPMHSSTGDVYLGYDPDESEIYELVLSPGDAYVLDNRTLGISQMPHATRNEPGRKMLAFQFSPEHCDPLNIDPGVTVIQGLRQI